MFYITGKEEGTGRLLYFGKGSTEKSAIYDAAFNCASVGADEFNTVEKITAHIKAKTIKITEIKDTPQDGKTSLHD